MEQFVFVGLRLLKEAEQDFTRLQTYSTMQVHALLVVTIDVCARMHPQGQVHAVLVAASRKAPEQYSQHSWRSCQATCGAR